MALAVLTLLHFGSCAVRAEEDSRWFERNRFTRQARELIDTLAHAESFGLRSRDYALGIAPETLHEMQSATTNATLQRQLDAALSRAGGRFVRDLHSGRSSARAAGFHLPAASPAFDVALVLDEIATTKDASQAIAALEPRARPYRLLKQALQRYRELARSTELTALPPLPQRSVKLGDEYSGAPQLRKLLVALDDLDAATAPAPDSQSLLDDTLVSAVQRFQTRHGLAADGVIGPRSFAALTTPLSKRVRQIELTLERWRWTSALERPDIVVNIPQFILFALPGRDEPSDKTLEMRVVVGQNYPHTRTPVFVSAIQRVIFQPYWDVPRGILERELLPLIRDDPAYLERNDMEIVRGPGDDATVLERSPASIEALARGELRLRQRPGAKNALGPVKFVLPNPYSVYLHATPAPELFERSRRAFSHGCIRVSEPALLGRTC